MQTNLMYSKPKYRGLFLVGVASISLSAPAYAQSVSNPNSNVLENEEDLGSLDVITVTGSRRASAIGEVPNSLSVLSEDDVREQLSTALSVDEVIERLVPGVQFANGGSPDSASVGGAGTGPSLRGRPASVLINGVQINTLLRGQGVDTQLIDPNAIGQVEVQRGASSTFGFGASGGVIQFLTRQGKTEEVEFNFRTGYSLSTEDTSFGNFEVYAGAGQDRGGLDYYVGFGFRDNNPTIGPDAQVVSGLRSDNNTYNVDANVGVEVGSDAELRIRGNWFRRDVNQAFVTPFFYNIVDPTDPDEGRILAPGIPNDATVVDPSPLASSGFQEAYTVSATFTHNNVFGSIFEASGFLYQNDLRLPFIDGADDDGSFENRFFRQFDQELDQQRFGLRANMVTDFTVWNEDDLTFTYGVDWVRDRIFRTLIEGGGDLIELDTPGFGVRPFELAGPEGFPISFPVELEGLGLYGQANFKVGRFLFTGGIRYEDSAPRIRSFTSGINEDEGVPDLIVEPITLPSFDTTLFNAGVIYDFTNNSQIYAGFTQGVEITEFGRVSRNPIRNQAFSRGGSDGVTSAEDVSTVALEPAKTTEYELGIRGDYAGLTYSAAAFFSSADLSARTEVPAGAPPNTLAQPIREPLEIWGVEATAQYSIMDIVNLGGTFTWQDGRIQPEGETEFRQVAFDILSAPRLVAFVDWNVDNDITLSATGTQVFDASPFGLTELNEPFGSGGDGDVNGFFVLDLAARFDTDYGAFIFGLSNALNNDFLAPDSQIQRDPLNQVPQPGRQLSFFYETTF